VLYVKTILLGFAFVVLTIVLVVVIAISALILFDPGSPDGTTIGWDPYAMMRESILPWLVLASGFAVGFFLGLRWFKATG
jgi:hypothetical protein